MLHVTSGLKTPFRCVSSRSSPPSRITVLFSVIKKQQHDSIVIKKCDMSAEHGKTSLTSAGNDGVTCRWSEQKDCEFSSVGVKYVLCLTACGVVGGTVLWIWQHEALCLLKADRGRDRALDGGNAERRKLSQQHICCRSTGANRVTTTTKHTWKSLSNSWDKILAGSKYKAPVAAVSGQGWACQNKY